MYAAMLHVVALEIGKQLRIDVYKFTLVYRYGNNTVHFVLNDDPVKIPLENSMLADGIKMFLDANAGDNPGFEIIYAIIFWELNKPGKIGIHFKHTETGEIKDETKAFD
jgi:hypothetical protein